MQVQIILHCFRCHGIFSVYLLCRTIQYAVWSVLHCRSARSWGIHCRTSFI